MGLIVRLSQPNLLDFIVSRNGPIGEICLPTTFWEVVEETWSLVIGRMDLEVGFVNGSLVFRWRDQWWSDGEGGGGEWRWWEREEDEVNSFDILIIYLGLNCNFLKILVP